MHESVTACEKTCIDAKKKKGCESFTYFSSGDLAKQCFASLEKKWSSKADSTAVSGRPYLLTASTVTLAAHPFTITMQEKFADLVSAISAWPVATKVKELAALAPPRPAVSDGDWLLLSALLFFWPAALHLLLPSASSADGAEPLPPQDAAPSPAPDTPAQEPQDKTQERIPVLSEVAEIGATVGRSLEESLQGLSAGIQNLLPKNQDPAPAPAEPAAVH